jgi:hypothetical protein
VSTRHLGVTLAACLLVLGLPAARARVHAENVPEEYRLKAAFVYRFPQFVEWPPASWTGREALEICVSQPNPFGSSLAEFVEGESLKGKRFVVRQVTAKGPIESCHVLFVAQTPATTKSDLLARAASLPILTVGDSPRFLDLGGIINLRLVDRRVRFEINLAAADRAGLRLSSQLLRLAMTVRGGRS